MSVTEPALTAAGKASVSLDLTVLACEAGRSSGYLLRHGANQILVDCGPGVIRALESQGDPTQLAAVVVTHQHADHSLDLLALACRLRYPDPAPPIPLYVPEPMRDLLDRLDQLFGTPTIGLLSRPIHDAFQIIQLNLAARPAVELADGLTMRAFPARHAVPSAALRFEASAATIAFSSDTGMSAAVHEAADSATLFACEATYGPTTPAEDSHGHLSAAQAGQIAARANVGRLLLTHMSRPEDVQPSLAAAAAAFSGPLDVAARNLSYAGAASYQANQRS